MNFIFSEAQIQFKDAIKSFLAEECSPSSIRDGWQANKSFNLDRWKNLIELGVLNSNLPLSDLVPLATVADSHLINILGNPIWLHLPSIFISLSVCF